MEITVIRRRFTDKSTISDVFIKDVYQCHIIEDKDRDLWFTIEKTMTLEEINKIKVYAETCIPYGRYEVKITRSNRFSKLAGHDVFLPELLNVPGWAGVRIHKGNKPEDSEGCLLPGFTEADNFVGDSKGAFALLYAKIEQALLTEKVFINIVKKGIET